MIKGLTMRRLLRKLDDRVGIGRLEQAWHAKWFNPLATVWINLRCFPLRQAWRMPLWAYGRPRLCNLSGSMRVEDRPVRSGMVRLNRTSPGAPAHMGVNAELTCRGTIVFRGRMTIGCGSCVRTITPEAVLVIGDRVKICEQTIVGVMERAEIGDHSWLVHRAQLFDTNYHYLADFSRGVIPYHTRPVKIGSGCWVCNGATIGPGAVLPDRTVVASGSVVTKDFSDLAPGSLIGGMPARYLGHADLCRVDSVAVAHAARDHYRLHPDTPYAIPSHITPTDCF